jgi:hypothetical protein
MYIVTVLGRNNEARDSENGLHKAICVAYKSAVNITVERPAHSISLQGFVVDIDATTEVVR